MKEYNCMILDDEYMAVLLLEEYVKKLPFLKLILSSTNGIEVLNALQNEKTDILFMDIQMPQINGLHLAQSLIHKPQIIFTTAYAEHAVEGFAINATDYLLKPFSFERFLQSVNKAIKNIEAFMKHKVSEANKSHFFVKSSGKLIKIEIQSIDYIEGLKEYVSIYSGADRIVTLQSLKNLEDELPSDQFKRVHKSYIINNKKIKYIEGNLIHLPGKSIPIGGNYKVELLKSLGFNGL